MTQAQEIRTKNAEYKAALEARRNSVRVQIASLCDSIAAAPQATLEMRLEVAEICLELFRQL